MDCPFCRSPSPDDAADILEMIQARVKKKDQNYRAMRHFLISAKMGRILLHLKLSRLCLWEGRDCIKSAVRAVRIPREALKGYQDAVEGMESHDRDLCNN